VVGVRLDRAIAKSAFFDLNHVRMSRQGLLAQIDVYTDLIRKPTAGTAA
jgi:hypothetical protein